MTLTTAPEQALLTATRDFLSTNPKRLLIGGGWQPANGGQTFATLNPATENGFGRAMGKDASELYTQVKTVRIGI